MTVSGWGLTAPPLTKAEIEMKLFFVRATFVRGAAYSAGDIADIPDKEADKLIAMGKATEYDEAAEAAEAAEKEAAEAAEKEAAEAAKKKAAEPAEPAEKKAAAKKSNTKGG